MLPPVTAILSVSSFAPASRLPLNPAAAWTPCSPSPQTPRMPNRPRHHALQFPFFPPELPTQSRLQPLINRHRLFLLPPFLASHLLTPFQPLIHLLLSRQNVLISLVSLLNPLLSLLLTFHSCLFFFCLTLFFFFTRKRKAGSGHPETVISARPDATETQRQQNYLLRKRGPTLREQVIPQHFVCWGNFANLWYRALVQQG